MNTLIAEARMAKIGKENIYYWVISSSILYVYCLEGGRAVISAYSADKQYPATPFPDDMEEEYQRDLKMFSESDDYVSPFNNELYEKVS